MNKENAIKIFCISILYGSLWGICEAVLGYVLHLIPFGVSGFVMFPVGFYFMNKGYKQTQNINTIFFIGFIAAAIKLVDFFLPFVPLRMIIDPAVSILLESLIIVFAFKLFVSKSGGLGMTGIVFSSVVWRVLFVLYMFFLTLFSIPSGMLNSGFVYLIKFMLFEGVINAVVIYIFARTGSVKKLTILPNKFQRKPIILAGIFMAALITTLVFSAL